MYIHDEAMYMHSKSRLENFLFLFLVPLLVITHRRLVPGEDVTDRQRLYHRGVRGLVAGLSYKLTLTMQQCRARLPKLAYAFSREVAIMLANKTVLIDNKIEQL